MAGFGRYALVCFCRLLQASTSDHRVLVQPNWSRPNALRSNDRYVDLPTIAKAPMSASPGECKLHVCCWGLLLLLLLKGALGTSEGEMNPVGSARCAGPRLTHPAGFWTWLYRKDLNESRIGERRITPQAVGPLSRSSVPLRVLIRCTYTQAQCPSLNWVTRPAGI